MEISDYTQNLSKDIIRKYVQKYPNSVKEIIREIKYFNGTKEIIY